MNEILIAIIPALLSFIGSIWVARSSIKKQELENEVKIAQIKLEANEKRESDIRNLEAKIEQIKVETDEEIRKAEKQIEHDFKRSFTNPLELKKQLGGLSEALEIIPDLERKVEESNKRQSRKGWK